MYIFIYIWKNENICNLATKGRKFFLKVPVLSVDLFINFGHFPHCHISGFDETHFLFKKHSNVNHHLPGDLDLNMGSGAFEAPILDRFTGIYFDWHFDFDPYVSGLRCFRFRMFLWNLYCPALALNICESSIIGFAASHYNFFLPLYIHQKNI